MSDDPSPPSPSPPPKTQTLIQSPSQFLQSYKSFSHQSPLPLTPPPLSYTLLSHHSPLPPTPPSLPSPALIPKTRFLVDAFRFAGDHSVSYFLSHFHSDHYTGLGPHWSKGLIFCSHTTARLLLHILKVPHWFVVGLALREKVCIDGCEVALVDANHCPGAVQFLFWVPVAGGMDERYVHTGDFRYNCGMKLDSLIGECVGADAVFLDTTYCNPKFVFPSQEESVDYIVRTIERIRAENVGVVKSVLFLIATYVVGKERILIQVSDRCGCMIHVDGRKMKTLDVLGYGERGVFTEDACASDVSVVGWNVLGETRPYFRPNFGRMKEIMIERGYSKVVGFVPTGWMYEAKRDGFAVRTKDSLEIHLVPYSEHSSYDELREYVKFLRPKKVVPMVGLDVEKLDSKHATAMRRHFAGLVDEMANKQEFLRGFYRGSGSRHRDMECNIGVDLNEGPDGVKEADPSIDLSATNDNINPGSMMNPTCSLQEPDSQDLTTPNSKESKDTEGNVQELRECLPNWVTEDQMLDLLNKSGGNIVEAVSEFYEHETEFREQVPVFAQPVGVSQTCSLSDSTLSIKLASAKADSVGSTLGNSNQYKNNLNLRGIPLNKTSPSPKKRRSGSEKAPNKKARQNSNLESSGSKQSAITKFFNRVVQDSSKVDSAEAAECFNSSGKRPQQDAAESYVEQLDQLLQVLDDKVPRMEAVLLLDKAKGDVNLALDLYYSNCGKVNEKEVVHETPLGNGETSTGSKKQAPAEIANVFALYDQKVSPENLSASLVLLPNVPIEKYSPVEHACWRAGEPAPYLHLARTFDLVERERGKIKATGILCNMFRSLLVLSPKDVLPAVYLCTNKIAADHKNLELNIGGSLVSAAIEEACGTNRSKIREMYNELGDLGDVAQLCRQTQSLLAPPRKLSIQEVFTVLQKISIETGNGSLARKKILIVNLMRSCREKEIKFLVRTLVRNLRIGAMMKTVLPALAQAILINSSQNILSEKGHHEGLKEKLQNISTAAVEAYNILPDLDLLVPSLTTKGIEFSSSMLSMVPSIPIKPMLARITNGVSQALKLFNGRSFTCEYKYDGQRAQIHKLDDGSVRIFSRNGDETTSRFPDLVNIINELCRPTTVNFIVDAEVVAVDRKNECKLKSFQELSSRDRGSKNSFITATDIKVDICIFAFDAMFANGKQLLNVSLRQRRIYLKDLFHDAKFGYFEYAKEITVEAKDASSSSDATLGKINSFLEGAFSSSCEGIMVKSLDVDAGYTASKRSDTWLKVKRDYMDGLNDTLDLVPIGAWHGNGRKAGWYSPFLMACYNPDTEDFQSVCRVMSGFSDSFYVEMKEFFSGEKILSKKPPYYQTAEVPDLWFSPELVWEIRGADFTVSPVHKAAIGLVHPSRGISIRFPRFIHARPDKRVEDCSAAADVAEMFHSQSRKMDVRMED
ncbi:hypothetical protein Sjap_015132 [Stephania japonica]|uniref:DNA ligase n=1 Tax=Stephania japonica TaxID=461633 RepID=A0AAP0NSK4_9MAGN